ncbi:hypothetical protein [Ruania rhizosphaerae]|uniref:hypothetical protein n=1 Tax=Ruania rhizosphaerae TaxID=1840413 RepID=UPI001F1B70C2|nr:hypothetical protein [Ruania rhizosphaerae]
MLTNTTGCSDAPTTDPCVRCDTLLGNPGIHVEAVERTDVLVTVTVSTPWQLMGCPTCGVVAPSRGRRRRELHDVPGIVPVRVIWRQRTWRCPDRASPTGTFVEQNPALVVPSLASLVRSGSVLDGRERVADVGGWRVGRGGDLAGQFLDIGALDEIALSVAPVALTGGAPVLPRRIESDRLRLVSATAFGEFARLVYGVESASSKD